MNESDSHVERLVVIHESNNVDVQVRLNGDGGIWVKPSELDGDGEFFLSFAGLGQTLEALNVDSIRLFPGVVQQRDV